jgi:hypothetical protein
MAPASSGEGLDAIIAGCTWTYGWSGKVEITYNGD